MNHLLTHSLTGVKCRATSVAKNTHNVQITKRCELNMNCVFWFDTYWLNRFLHTICNLRCFVAKWLFCILRTFGVNFQNPKLCECKKWILSMRMMRTPGMSHKIWQSSLFRVKYPKIFSPHKRAKFAQAVRRACYNRLLAFNAPQKFQHQTFSIVDFPTF